MPWAVIFSYKQAGGNAAVVVWLTFSQWSDLFNLRPIIIYGPKELSFAQKQFVDVCSGND